MNHMWSHVEGQSLSEETEAERTGDRSKLKHPGTNWLKQADRLWKKDDEKGMEDQLRLAGFPPPATSSGDQKPAKLKSAKESGKTKAEAKKQQEQAEWSELPAWGDETEREAEASSSWEPHSEKGSETGNGEAEAEPEGDDGPPQKRKRGHRGGWKHKKWWEKYPNKGGKGGRGADNRWEW